MHLRRFMLPAVVLLAGCIDDPSSPNRLSAPAFDHTTAGPPPATININNYAASFQESGLETFYKGDVALFTGGLAYGTDASTVHIVNTGFGIFDIAQTGLPVRVSSSPLADYYTSTVMAEQPALSNELGIVTVRETFSFANAPDDDYLIVKYSLTNTTSSPIGNLHVGYMADPDLHDYAINVPNEYQLNIASFDAATQSARVRLNHAASTTQHAIISLSHAVGGYAAWGNNGGAFPDRDPADAAGWFSLISSGAFSATYGPLDIRQYVGTVPTTLAPGETKVYAFALVGGDNATDLTANINAARSKAGALTTPVAALAAGVNIVPGTSSFTARISFASSAQASMFSAADTRCGGATIGSSVVTGNYVDVAFGALELDPTRRSGAAMHCAGVLSDGTYFAGTDYPVFLENTIPVTRVTTLTSADHGATWSPDGSKIAFASNRLGGGVFIMDPAIGEASVTQLVAAPNVQQISWSSTGKIAYSRGGNIWIVDAAGGTPVVIEPGSASVSNTDPRFSPDGSRIAFRRQSLPSLANTLMVMNADGTGDMQVAAEGLYPEWLSNTKVLFTRVVAPAVDERIYTVEVGLPTSETRLTPSEGGTFRFPEMSPDGNTLLFIAGNQLVMQDMQSGLHTIVMTNPGVAFNGAANQANLEYSPDGQRILFVTVGANIDVGVMQLPQQATPAERAEELSNAIESLIAEGMVSAAEGAQLTDKLGTVSQMIAAGNLNPAVNHVNSFINKVNALVNSRRLSRITGEQLTSEANLLIAQLQTYSN